VALTETMRNAEPRVCAWAVCVVSAKLAIIARATTSTGRERVIGRIVNRCTEFSPSVPARILPAGAFGNGIGSGNGNRRKQKGGGGSEAEG
jgi:hypothetical protein